MSCFSNWASTQIRNEILSVSPTTVEEVQAVVRAARQLGLRVRAAGRTHSWTPLFSDEGDIVMHVRDIKRPKGAPQIELTQVCELSWSSTEANEELYFHSYLIIPKNLKMSPTVGLHVFLFKNWWYKSNLWQQSFCVCSEVSIILL